MISSTQSHMSQWDRVRVETEARLSSTNSFSKPTTTIDNPQFPLSFYDRGSSAPASNVDTFLSSWKTDQIATNSTSRPPMHQLDAPIFHTDSFQGLRSSQLWSSACNQLPAETPSLASTSGSQEDNHVHHSRGSSTSNSCNKLLNPMSPTSILVSESLWDCTHPGESLAWQNLVHVQNIQNSYIQGSDNGRYGEPQLQVGYGESGIPENCGNVYDVTQSFSQLNNLENCRVQTTSAARLIAAPCSAASVSCRI